MGRQAVIVGGAFGKTGQGGLTTMGQAKLEQTAHRLRKERFENDLNRLSEKISKGEFVKVLVNNNGDYESWDYSVRNVEYHARLADKLRSESLDGEPPYVSVAKFFDYETGRVIALWVWISQAVTVAKAA